MIYIRDDGEMRYNFSHAKQVLTMFQALCLGEENANEALCDAFDRDTENGSDMSFYDDLLDKAIQAIIANFQKRDLHNIFKGRDGKLVQQEQRASKQDDFELISWLVIKEPDEG